MLSTSTLGGFSIHLAGELGTDLASCKTEMLPIHIACADRPQLCEVRPDIQGGS